MPIQTSPDKRGYAQTWIPRESKDVLQAVAKKQKISLAELLRQIASALEPLTK